MADNDVWICYGPRVENDTFVPWAIEAIDNLSQQIHHNIDAFDLGEVPSENISCGDQSATLHNVEQWLETNYNIRDHEHYMLLVQCDFSRDVGAGGGHYTVSRPDLPRDYFNGFAAITVVNQGVRGYVNSHPLIPYSGKKAFKATVIHETCHTLMTPNDDDDPYEHCPQGELSECIPDHVCGKAYDGGNISPMLLWYSNNSARLPSDNPSCQSLDEICYNSGEDNVLTYLISDCTELSIHDHVNQHIHWFDTNDTFLDERWSTKDYYTEYQDPVVIAGPPEQVYSEPCHIRIRNVGSTDFEIRLEEWKYQDGDHNFEELTYLIVDQEFQEHNSTQRQSDGTRSLAGTVTADETWTQVSFSSSFNDTPIVLCSIQTKSGLESLVHRIKNVDTDGFEVRLQQEEALNGNPQEEVGYFAISEGTGFLEGVPYEARRLRGIVDDDWYTMGFRRSYTDPTFVADMQTLNGGDPCNLRFQNLSSTSVDLRVQEEQSSGTETGHLAEDVGVLAFNDSV